jgi:hypothetical protein
VVHDADVTPASDIGHAFVCWHALPLFHVHWGSPPLTACVHAAGLVAWVGHAPVAVFTEQEPLKAHPVAALQADAPASIAVGQLGAEQEPVQLHRGSPLPPTVVQLAEVTDWLPVGQGFVIWQFGTNAQLDARVPPTVHEAALAFVPQAPPANAHAPV